MSGKLEDCEWGRCDQREEGKRHKSLTTQIQEVIVGAQHSSPQEQLAGGQNAGFQYLEVLKVTSWSALPCKVKRAHMIAMEIPWVVLPLFSLYLGLFLIHNVLNEFS